MKTCKKQPSAKSERSLIRNFDINQTSKMLPYRKLTNTELWPKFFVLYKYYKLEKDFKAIKAVKFWFFE